MSKQQETVLIQDRDQKQSNENELDQSFDERDGYEKASGEHEFEDEQLGELLDAQQVSKEQMMLRFKVEELQKICNSLSETNRKLITKITKMQEELEDKQKSDTENEIFIDQYSELNCEFTEVQELINEYRESLNHFQKTVISDLQAKDTTNAKLQEQIKNLKRQVKQLQNEKEQIEKLNKQLETRNEGLILEVQNLEKNNAWLEQRSGKNYGSPYNQNQSGILGHRYDNSNIYTSNEDDISSEMQAELEGMINRLVKQLEHERILKRKLNEEIKRMSGDLMDSEREIMQKNKKLYELQMKMLKNSKNSTSSTSDSSVHRYRQKLDEEKTQRLPNSLSKPQNTRINLKNFILLELINEEINEPINTKERLLIGLKVLELFERKIEKQDYSSVMPENILVSNFNHKRPELISVRKNGQSTCEDGEESQGITLWNLAFILDNLFGGFTDSNEEYGEILLMTGEMIDRQESNSREDLQNLKIALCA